MSGQDPLVRDAADADLEAIAEIYAYHVIHGLASFEETPPEPAEMAGRRDAVRAAGLPYLAAEIRGRVLGFAYAAPYRDRPAYRHTVEDSVYVAPEAQGRGIGAALLGRLIELCTACGRRQMVAVIGDSGNLSSIRLHERFGFRRAGLLENVGRKHGRWVDSVILQRSLGPGATSPPEG